jgi:FkbM family methyltransferase
VPGCGSVSIQPVSELVLTRRYYRRRFFRRLYESFAKRYYRARHSDREFIVSYFGAKFRVNMQDAVLRNIALKNFERAQLNYFVSACRRIKPDLFIDVGANAGLYSCIVAKCGLAENVIALEPDAQNFAALQENISLNGVSVTTLQTAASDQVGASYLKLAPFANRGLSRLSSSGQPITLSTIDSIAHVSNKRIAIKIDVEDHELEVLRGALNTLRSNTGIVQLETSPERYVEVKQLLNAAGYNQIQNFDHDVAFEKHDGRSRPLPELPLS